MKDAILTLFVVIFWVLLFGYLLCNGFLAVAFFSAILLGMTIALATSDDN